MDFLKTESERKVFFGGCLMVCSLVALKWPHYFIKGRRSRIWVEKYGEEFALKIVKYFSVPLLLVVGSLLV